MRIVSWNINSVRLRLPLLSRLAGELKPDIICLQEIKGENQVFPAAALQELGYPHQAVRGMKGYNGVAILSRQPFRQLPERRWAGREDARHIAVTLTGGVELHNFYVPAGGDLPDPAHNEKFAHKLTFLEEMQIWSRTEKGRSRIMVGDLNIAPLPEDVWSHKQLLNVVSHTPVETEGLLELAEQGEWIDAHRALAPPPEKLYSWWSYRSPQWEISDRGRRLDHVWLSSDLRGQLQAAGIHKAARGWQQASDHAPVWADFSW
jgi:exodeoxyribonuclease III